MPREDRCRLCKCQKALDNSHIIPAFVFRWLKKTSSTGYLRFGQQMNQRVQDGLKTPFLCRDCEERFSKWEKQMAGEFFFPFHKDSRATFAYDVWMAKFCVSMSWRVLAYMQERYQDADFDGSFGADAERALSVWADFLLDKRSDIGDFEQHLLPLGPIMSTDGALPSNIQRYLMRAVEIDRILNTESAFTFAKLGHVVLMGFIREPEPELWQGTRIEIGAGLIAPTHLTLPDWLSVTFKQRSEQMAELQSQISPRQWDRIVATQRANEDRVFQSETLRARLEDRRLSEETEREVP